MATWYSTAVSVWCGVCYDLILSSDISAMKYLCSPIAKVVQRVKEKAQVNFQQKLEFEASREVACSLPWQL